MASNDVQTFRTAYAKYGAGRFVGLTIGNEVNDSVGNIMAKVYDVRGIAFYDGGRTSGQAGDFVFKTVVPALKAACPGKKVIISESGWPSRGGSIGVAAASVADERNALLNLSCACRDDTSVSVYAFEYDDQLWKANDNERSFGIAGKFNLLDKSQQWNSLAADAKKSGYKSLRITGFDCDALSLASSAAAANGLMVLAGIYASGDTIGASIQQIDNDVQAFRDAYAKYGADRYVGLTIGNEVNDSPENIMSKVNDVRGMLMNA
ncbi:hypothetical protein H0H87_004384 [Tephrocybe sp. NHM501043]|nr:hypothetical protein H0H87_004384 [Tephrocybe sp. NHM501043]